MKKMKLYEPEDRMISLIRDNYSVLQSLGAFGISLGFGDKSVREVCEMQNVDTYTFLAVVNLALNGYRTPEDEAKLSVPTLLKYLKASHEYYLEFQLPFIRSALVAALDENDNLARLILRLYDDYAKSIHQHMKYEEKALFPYVEALLRGETIEGYNTDTFSKHHGDTSEKLKELKNIIIKYLPGNTLRNNQLTACLYNIYNNEEWLQLEMQTKSDDVSMKISRMIGHNPDASEALSDREKDVIVAMVQGMSNKEIADHLFISINTVITHRRNIARKLQIHSPAGLTIYAIVNNLIDISNVRL